MAIMIEISPAELFDRIGILEIKLRRLTDPPKLENVAAELERLRSAEAKFGANDDAVRQLRRRLDDINDEIWVLTDEIYRRRAGEADGAVLVELCLRAFDLNRDRSLVKRRIDSQVGSAILEEKNYGDFVRA